MQAIVSELDGPIAATARAIWQRLELELGLTGSRALLRPHVTWLASDGIAADQARDTLPALVQARLPLTVTANGIGVFIGERPTLHLPVVRTREVDRLHHAILRALPDVDPLPQYDPALWQPHVTLAVNDVTWEELPTALMVVRRLIRSATDEVRSLTLIVDDSLAQHVIAEHFDPGGALVVP